MTYGSPSKVLHCVSSTLSLRKIADILYEKSGIMISHVKVSQILSEMGYSKQASQKMEQAAMPSPYRDKQFRHIRTGQGVWYMTGNYRVAYSPAVKDGLKDICFYIAYELKLKQTAVNQVNRICKEIRSLDTKLKRYSFVDWEPGY